MAELKRTERQLTTEDFARKTAGPSNPVEVQDPIAREESGDPERPRPMRNEIQDARVTRASDFEPPTTDNRAQDAGGMTPLLSESELGELRSRWSNIQAEFVDEPRRAVEEADQLVATAMQRLADGFANERASLEKQWDSGDNASTEDLRLALQRYRTFFGRLLNAA
jgi:hypothetical protein